VGVLLQPTKRLIKQAACIISKKYQNGSKKESLEEKDRVRWDRSEKCFCRAMSVFKKLSVPPKASPANSLSS